MTRCYYYNKRLKKKKGQIKVFLRGKFTFSEIGRNIICWGCERYFD